MPANRDKMQSPESDGKVDDDMMKANIQNNGPSKENSEGAEAAANCIGWSRRSAGCTEGRRILRFGLWFIFGIIHRPTGKLFSDSLLCWRGFDWL